MRALRPLIALLLSSLSGCVAGSGRIETRALAIEGFDAIEANRDIQVEVTRGDRFAVQVSADDNLWQSLEVTRNGTTLALRLPSSAWFSNYTVRAVVSMPALARLHLSGTAGARLAGFDARAPRLDIRASGSSAIAGDANVDALTLELSGGSDAQLSGSAGSVRIDGSGGSHVNLAAVRAATAKVSLSGGSYAAVAADGTLDYQLSGGSHLDYFGDPRIAEGRSSGGSTVSRR